MKRKLSPFWQKVSAVFGVIILLTAINQIFMLNLTGSVILENSYHYLLLGFGLMQMFIVYKPFASSSDSVAWYDLLFGAACLGPCLYFAWHGRAITSEAWMVIPPHEYITVLSVLLCLLLLEGVRRTAGNVLLLICAFFMVYPMFAHVMPGFMQGHNLPAAETLTFHALSSQSILGITMGVVGSLLIGYIAFGTVLNGTGGGDFFLNVSFALLGRFRGGAAKVAVLASAIFGSMSGSAISNVVTTGVVTIPAMKKSGFAPEEAGAVEACASTGGVLMPPVMGAAAFLMAQFLGVPYLDVALAAVIPSLLYYTGLLVQVDGLAARKGIKGLSQDQIPRLKGVLSKGWVPLVAFALLIYFLLIRQEDRAPYFSIAFMLLACMVFKIVPFGLKELVKLLASISAGLSEIIVTIAAVGFIIGSMSLTGVGSSISGELVGLAGGNIYLMLIFGAVASFILGMGMSTSACYIFLAVVLAPGLTAQGMPAMAIHLFILYWAMASNITPPVALACFPAANIAGASYMKVGVKAVTFGFVTLIVPFLFVLQPSVIFIGTTLAESLVHIGVAFTGVVLASFGLAGYVPFIGRIHRVAGLIVAAGGTIIALPTPMAVNIASFVALIAYLVGLRLFTQRGRTTESVLL